LFSHQTGRIILFMKLKYRNHSDLAIIRNPVIDRKTFVEHMTFEKNHGPLFTEIFGPIIGLKEEWEEQGASPGELDFSAFSYRCAGYFDIPVCTGPLGGDKRTVVEETEEYIIYRDNLGRDMKRIFQSATLALPLNFPVKNGDDWKKVKHLYEFSEERFSPGWEEQTLRALERGEVITLEIPGGFDEPRQLMGEEELSYAWYEQPELVAEILQTISDTAWRVIDRVTSKVPVDRLFIHEDMAGKSGPLIGPVQVEEFLKPYYRGLWDRTHARGCRIFDQDSDGNMEPVIGSFVDCGVNCMHPLEPAAGMDMVSLRKTWGKQLAFVGGLDKFAVRDGGAVMEEELTRKIPFMVESGGCMLGLDHRIPNGTPLENYRQYLRRARNLMGLEIS